MMRTNRITWVMETKSHGKALKKMTDISFRRI